MPAYFDQYSQNYKNILAAELGGNIDSVDFYARQKINHLKRRIKEIDKIQLILDYGCGIGTSFKHLNKAFQKAQIIGVDVSRSSLDIAYREYRDIDPKLFTPSDFEKITPRPLFDLIFLSCVLHHVESKLHRPLLASLRSHCNAKGMIAIVEHNPINPLTRSIVNKCPFDKDAILIRRSHTCELLRSTGWHNIKWRYITFFPYSLAKFEKAESLLTWCPLGGQYLIIAGPSN